MSFSLNGKVLKPSRAGTSNARSTGDNNSTVSREHIVPSTMSSVGYNIVPNVPVEPYTDMYTVALLNRDIDKESYAVFSHTNSQFSDLESVVVTSTDNVLPLGFEEFITRFQVKDPNGRTLNDVSLLGIQIGGSGLVVQCTLDTVNTQNGIVTLSNDAITTLGGGYSKDRGDAIVYSEYTLSPPKFYWSRNDTYRTRFTWDGVNSKWIPFKGSAVKDVGQILPDTKYELNPTLTGLQVGTHLPIDLTTNDSFCYIRYGLYGDATSIPLAVLVVQDDLADEGEWRADLGWNTYEAVIGETNSVLVLNPSFIISNQGLHLWYNPNSFDLESTGEVGLLQDLNTANNINHPVLSPIPDVIEHPLLKIGNRTYLQGIQVDSDNDLPTPDVVPEGTVYWSRTTGKTCFSDVDINKSKPSSSTYHKSYLLTNLYYDGVVLTSKPVPLRQAVPVINEQGQDVNGVDAVVSKGRYYLKPSIPIPPPGVSGILIKPDVSGDIPNTSVNPQTRPNGSGLVRAVKLGDSFFFNTQKRYVDTDVVEYETDLKTGNYNVAADTIEVSRMVSDTQPIGYTDTSKLQFKRKISKDLPLYFIQSNVVLASYQNQPKLYSRLLEPYVVQGGEKITISVDGVISTTTLSTGTYTAQDLAVYLNSTVPNNVFNSFRGRLYIEGVQDVEVGYNSDVNDLSGHTVLGFQPTWKVDTQNDSFRWLADTGISMELYRSPINLDNVNGQPDTKAYWTLEDKVIEKSILSFPFQPLEHFPLEDIPGYEEGVHFKVVLGGFPILVPNYSTDTGISIIYDYNESRLNWVEVNSTRNTKVEELTYTLQNDFDIVPQTVSSLTMQDNEFGLYYKSIQSSFNELVIGEDFILEDGGASGLASLVDKVAPIIVEGSNGFGAVNIFSNPVFSNDPIQNTELQQNMYDTIQLGHTLELQTGDSKGLYTVVNKDIGTGTCLLQVSPNLPYIFTNALWRVFSTEEEISLVTDVKGLPQSYFVEEPIQVRLVRLVGTSDSALYVITDLIQSGVRDYGFRFGLEYGNVEPYVFTLQQGVDLGLIRDTNLYYPDITSPYFTQSSNTNIYFQFRVQDEVFNTINGNLTWDQGLDVDKIDINSTTGEILVGDNVLKLLSGDVVYLDELFRDNLQVNEVELDLGTGLLNISSLVPSGTLVYSLVWLLVEGNKDVQVSPLNGGMFLFKPLQANDMLETTYFLADDYGDILVENNQQVQVTEFLSSVVSLEEATYVNEKTFSFNPLNKTLDKNFQITVWVDGRLQNERNTTFTADYDNNQLLFNIDLDSTAIVQVNYAVLQFNGGEQTFSTTQYPLYRKPLLINANTNTFDVPGYRVEDFPPLHLLSIDTTAFYITSSVYNSDTGITTVTIDTPPTQDTGSNSPGNDSSIGVSDFPVKTNTNFLLTITNSFSPIDIGTQQIVFEGDVTQFTNPNHVIELNGVPFIVVANTVSDNGEYTVVDLSTSIPFRLDVGTVKVSRRPVMFNLTQTALPYIPVPTEDVYLLKTNVNKPGQLLTNGVDYILNGDGSITLTQPLEALDKLYGSYVRYIQVGPQTVLNGLFYPEYQSKYLTLTEPDSVNRIEGALLKGTYTYYSPDSYYIEVQTLQDYMFTVMDELLSNTASTTSGSSIGNSCIQTGSQGVLGLTGEVVDLENKDRAARTYIEFYNSIIVGFEQILEATSGKFIGDRDGKFNFYIGHDRKYSPEGFESPITGKINPRNIWRNFVEEWALSLGEGFFKESDPVSDPETTIEQDASTKPGYTDGKAPNVQQLDYYLRLQRQKIRNDMDDRVLVGVKGLSGLASLFPSINLKGVFKYMSERHILSRLYPNETKHFSRLLPGLESDIDTNGDVLDGGYYSPGRTLEVRGPKPGDTQEIKVSTRNTQIGDISNPALGVITGIVDVNVQRRYARGRIWAYYPEGNENLDNVLGCTTVGKATVITTPLYLSDFPISTETGYPDVSTLLSQGGNLKDLNSGDNELYTPALLVGDRLQWGVPTGGLYDLLVGESGIYVEEIQLGCIVTLQDADGNSVIGTDIIVSTDQTLDNVANGFGDTLLATAPKDFTNAPTDTDSPTVEQLEELIDVIPDYRIGYDIKVNKTTGQFLDKTLPGKDDNGLNIRSIFGQNPPTPLSTVEGQVNFIYSEPTPATLPCLLGQEKDDSGDVQVPYMKPSGTEIELLTRVFSKGYNLFKDTTYIPLPSVSGYVGSYTDTEDYQYWDSVLPDEIRGVNGTYYAVQDGVHSPSVLYTGESLRPITGTGQYQSKSGIGSGRKYDLLLVELGQTYTPSNMYQGIHSIGNIQDDRVELPRYVTPTTLGDTVYYDIRGTHSHKGNGVTGCDVTETVVGSTRTINFDFSSIPDFNFQTLINHVVMNNNVFKVNFYDPAGGYLGTITFQQTVSGSGFWTKNSGGGIVANALTSSLGFSGADVMSLDMNSAPVSPLLWMGLVSGQTYDISIDLDTYITTETNTFTNNSLTVGAGDGSTTAHIKSDRLTFSEILDLRTAKARNTYPFNGDVNYEMGLQLDFVAYVDGGLITVNGKNEINGGELLTYLERVGPSPDGVIPVGVPYVASTDTFSGRSEVKAMSWEGYQNTSWGGTDVSSIKFSVTTSSDLAEYPQPVNSPLFNGSGTMIDERTTALYEWIGSTAFVYSLSSPDYEGVQSGDIAIIERGVLAGTYLVRHSVVHNGYTNPILGQKLRAVKSIGTAGTDNVFDLTFPLVDSIDEDTDTIVLSNVVPVSGTSTGCGFNTNTRVYFIISEQYAEWDGSAYQIFEDSVYSCIADVSYDSNTQQVTLTGLSTFRDATDGIILKSKFYNGISVGVLTSGMTSFNVTQLHNTLPQNNCVGVEYNSITGNNLQAGFEYITLTNTQSFHDFQPSITYDSGTGTIVNNVTGTPPSPSIVVRIPVPTTANQFIEDKRTPLYVRKTVVSGTNTSGVLGVATSISLDNIPNVDWELIHFDNVGIPGSIGLSCVLPGDSFVLNSDKNTSLGTPGFYALAGLYFEPSFPKSTTLGYTANVNDARVVCDQTGVTPVDLLGKRQLSDYTSPPVSLQVVNVLVRRIRRFHEEQTEIQDIVQDLPYVYEMRKGLVNSVLDKTVQAVNGTQLGGFTNPKVNIQSGDFIRLFDTNDNLVETAEIVKVVDDNTLKLKYSLIGGVSYGRFEVYLKNNLSPLEQSSQELYETITQDIVFKRTVNRVNSSEDGGFVTDFNSMEDTLIADWQSVGVQEGDYVVIDPQGTLYTQEEIGSRPRGDVSITEGGQDKVAISDTGVVNTFIGGTPDTLDDNRGFYRISTLDPDNLNLLPVDGASLFSGGNVDGSDNVIFGDIEDYGLGLDYRYVVLPTVNNSTLTSDTEGQQSLRPTSRPVSDRYLDRVGIDIHKSIEPFEYTIIRPTTLVSRETVELVLFTRERMLSWIEEIRTLYNGQYSGDYYVFQRDDHITNLGRSSDPSTGLGVYQNQYIIDIQGLGTVAPFSSNADCLSILDRRFWILDTTLDYTTPIDVSEFYTQFVSGVGEQRPVLPDYINDTLSLDEDLRGQRYSWINVRSNIFSGSLVQAKQASDSIESKQQEERRLAKQQQNSSGSTGEDCD